MDITSAILTALLALAPHSRQRPPPGWEETREAYEARLGSIAADISSAAGDSRERAVKLVGVAWHEGGFAADVDAGECYQGAGHKGRCDHDGKSQKAWGLWQLQKVDGVDVKSLSRREQAREALRRIERSERACSGNAAAERLAAYASGTCGLLTGRAAARSLYASIQRARRALDAAAVQ